ncbi:type IV secretion system protein [Caulobacter sp. NIBR2454]|uniref:type IV secretion system protein n=1 Tax=Caulobacter sp. NIBR2454 TaxID=3015996 RepID=UPI0022B65E8A|nr:type IV secretion system protein [Caulobacter sp. NIBR2454]
MRPAVLAAIVCGASLTVAPAHGAMIVHDPTAYAKLVEELRTALDQLDTLKSQLAEGRKLHDSLNIGSAIDQIAPQLAGADLRKALPDLAALQAAARGDLSALGAIGEEARQIREARRKYRPEQGDAAGAILERGGDLAARDLAVGEAATKAAGERLEGLRELQVAVGRAESARAVADLQARISAEQALIANDQMRLQALALTQAAEERMQRQEAMERAAAERKARMEFYRRGFQ